MKNIDEQIKELQAKSSRLYKQLNNLTDQGNDVDDKIRSLKIQKVFDENILNDTEWNLQMNWRNGKAFLIADRDDLNELMSMFSGDYYYFDLNINDLKFRVDDEEFKLYFDSDEELIKTIKRFNLKVDYSYIKEQMEKALNDYISLKNAINLIKNI